MTDLFRGYDLTTVADKVAEAQWARLLSEAREKGFNKEVPEWDTLGAVQKLNYKSTLLPIITSVLEALESEQVKPTEAKIMHVYDWTSFQQRETGIAGYEDDVNQHDKATCTTWVLHMNLHPLVKDAVLERMAVLPETTGEYTYGDSWTEWGEPTTDDTDRHMAIYFDATPRRAAEIGTHLANHATFAGMKALGGDGADIPPFAISTSGDYAEQLEVPQ